MKLHYLGIQEYNLVWQRMKEFTVCRTKDTEDELWLLQHPPVYTQGQAGKPEHILHRNNIPIVHSDRGGQVTYHGPGQLIVYTLIDIGRLSIGINTLVCRLEQVLMQVLAKCGIKANTRCGAPGVYVKEKKIASIGLRVKNACTYHGIALNVDMDLSPFAGINPCGFAKMEMTQIKDFHPFVTMEEVGQYFVHAFLSQFETNCLQP